MKATYRLFLFFISIPLLNSCLSSALGDGSNRLVKESPNVAHTKKAVLFLREAGTTTGDSYQVSIVDGKAEFDSTSVGNTFTMDGDHGKASLSPSSINFRWPANDTLEINYDKKLRTFVQVKSMNGVNVIYKKID